MNRDYESQHFDDFPSLKEGLSRYGKVAECDLQEMEAVFAAHELGHVSKAYADLILRLIQTHRLGLISNIWARKEPWLAEVQRAGIADAFEILVFSSDSQSIKPSKTLFQQALEPFPSGSQFIVIGDSLRCDIEPARALGLATGWITAEQRPDLADYLLRDLHAIEEA